MDEYRATLDGKSGSDSLVWTGAGDVRIGVGDALNFTDNLATDPVQGIGEQLIDR